MNLKTRRILYSFFVALFFLAAPPLVLYTTGFRYDFRYNRIVETGSMVIKTNPEQAAIYFNGERRLEETPTIINNILPGKITLLLKKEGYHDWEKTVTIAPRYTTVENNVTLFLDEPPTQLIDTPLTDFWWNTDRNRIAYLTTENQLRIRNMLNNDDILVANIGSDVLRDVAWSLSDDLFLFGRGKGHALNYYIIDTHAHDTSIAIGTKTIRVFDQVLFDPKNSNRVYALTNGTLMHLTYTNSDVVTYTLPPITRFSVNADRIALIHATPKGNSYLSWFSTNTPNTVTAFPKVELGKNARPEFIGTAHIGAYDTLADTLVLFPTTTKTDPLIFAHVNEFTTTSDGKRIMFSDGYALYAYDLSEQTNTTTLTAKQQLIIRYSQPIGHFALSDDEQYLYYVLGNTIRVVERDDAVIPRTLILLSDERMRSFTYTKTDRAESIDFISTNNELLSLPLTRKEDRSFFFGN